MFTRTYYPSSAGSVIMPTSSYGGYAGSGYAGSAYGGHYGAPMMAAPMMAPSYHHRPAPVVVPTSYGGYGYGGQHMPYYGAMTPTVVVSDRSSRRWRRHSRRWEKFHLKEEGDWNEASRRGRGIGEGVRDLKVDEHVEEESKRLLLRECIIFLRLRHRVRFLCFSQNCSPSRSLISSTLEWIFWAFSNHADSTSNDCKYEVQVDERIECQLAGYRIQVSHTTGSAPSNSRIHINREKNSPRPRHLEEIKPTRAMTAVMPMPALPLQLGHDNRRRHRAVVWHVPAVAIATVRIGRGDDDGGWSLVVVVV
ncbi:hypothetical protein FPV67DRAFT_1657848 [Lyophyllum atratum]|nr:hypothetical protein FPV67DRAFT_1657848 [Lyophyllum atratum]